MKVTKEMAIEYCEKLGIDPGHDSSHSWTSDGKNLSGDVSPPAWTLVQRQLQAHFNMQEFYEKHAKQEICTLNLEMTEEEVKDRVSNYLKAKEIKNENT